nr:Uma2 family endonuclease [Pyrinomonadaceae bacterium]
MAVKESDVTEQVAPREKMTFEEFLRWDSEHTMAEWIDGEVHVMSPAAKQHQEIVVFFVQVLGLFVKVRDLGVLLPAPFVMRTPASVHGREPDLLFVSRERAHLIEKTYL